MNFSSSTSQYLLGIDFGMMRIGLAIGLENIGLVRPLKVLKYARNGSDWMSEMSAIIKTWDIKKCILGLPLTLEGKPQGLTKKVKSFAKLMQNTFELPIYFQDERLTTQAARLAVLDSMRNRQKGLKKMGLDAVAAAIILQAYLEQASLMHFST